MLVFGVTGFLLGREAYFNLFSLHFAGEGVQLAFLILSPVIGAIVGALLAPLAHIDLRRRAGAGRRRDGTPRRRPKSRAAPWA